MRLLICAGGSGGGVYPALSVLQAMKDKVGQVLWVGSQGGMEAELVTRAGIPFTSVPASAVHGVGFHTLTGLFHSVCGYFVARKVIHDFKPDAMFFTGGYVAVPVALAGRKVPILLYVPDIEPGLALKILALLADHIALIAEDSRAYFSGHARLTVTGHPTRKELVSWNLAKAREVLALSPDFPTLLVFGGSKGARSINRAVLAALSDLLTKMQIVHVTGKLDWPEVETAMASLPIELAPRYRAYPYLHEEMGAAYTAADLVLSRAGASAVGELPLFGAPAILVPYPYAWRYQWVNAEYMVRNGAAVVLDDAALPTNLLSTVCELMLDSQRIDQMRAAIRALARPEAAKAIANCLYDLVEGPYR